jgi:hypothetical protein
MVLTKYLNKITYSEFKVVLLLGLKTAGIADELVVYPNISQPFTCSKWFGKASR